MRRFLSVAMAAFVCLAAVPANAQTQATLRDVPHPALDEFKPEVRELLAGARRRFEAMSAQAKGNELGVAYGRLGLHYFAHELQDAARAAFENAAELDPQNYRWHYYLAVHYDETGDYDNATRLYERALAFNPRDSAIATRLGLALLELERIDRASRYFEEVLSQVPTSAAAHAGLARCEEARGRLAEAEQHYLQALDLDPEADQLHYRLGQLYRRLGDMDKARTYLEKRGTRIASIDDPTLQFMQAHSRPASDYVALGNLALGNGEAERAFKYFDLAAAIDPENAPALIGKARIAFVSGDLAAARKLAGEARALEPAGANVAQLLGLIADQSGDLDAAIGYFRSALAADSQFHAVRALLANALMRSGHHADAGAQYAMLAGQSEKHRALSFQAGMAYIAGGDCGNAEKNLLAAFELSPDNPQVILALSRVYATCPDANQEQRETALKFAEAMYNSVPNMETSETFAMTLAANARYDDAVDLQAQAIFEAIKLGVMANNPHLTANMDRYRDGQPATVAWPSSHEIFSALPLVESTAEEK